MVAAIVAILALAVPQAEETVTISGTVTYGAKIRRIGKVPMTPDCLAMHPERPKRDTLVVDKDKNLKWAFVYIKAGVKGERA